MRPDTRPTGIPGVETFHRREVWQEPHMPVTGPRITWPTIDIVAVHYPWAEPTAGSLDDILKVTQFLRRTQADYVLRRGFSIGYNFHVDWLGGVWESRGFDIRCAANRTVNPRTIAVQLLVDWDGAATDLALASLRAIHLEVERRAARECPSLGHNMLPDPDSPTGVVRTACAGAGITPQIHAGLTTPDRNTEPPTEEVDMLIVNRQEPSRPDGNPNPDWVATMSDGPFTSHLHRGDTYQRLVALGVRQITLDDAEFEGWLRSTSTTTPAPGNLPQNLRALWEARRS